MQKAILKKVSFMTAGGTLLFGVSLWTPSHSQSIDKPDTPLKVALVLDCITQPRFQDDMKNFGMSRMLPMAGGHLMAGSLRLDSKKDQELFQSAEASRRDFAIGFFHCAHVPGKRTKTVGLSEENGRAVTVQFAGGGFGGSGALHPGQDDPSYRISLVANRLRHLYASDRATADTTATALYSEMAKESQKALPTLMKGQGAQQDSGDWLIVERPVTAMKPSCLKCHQGAKLGDTLGVLTYAVSKKTFMDVVKPSVPGGKGSPKGSL